MPSGEGGNHPICIVACGSEVVSAFMRLEVWQHVTDGVPEALDRPLRRFAQERLELCEGILDGVEVRTVGREVVEFSSCCFDEFANPWPFVAREVVHDDDVAGA